VPTGSLEIARDWASATLLPDGTVLVAGGFVGDALDPDSTSTAELYDPSTGTWSSTGSMADPRATHIAILLPTNGNVLVVGGFSANRPVLSVELYDPTTRIWSSTGSMAGPRNNFTATLLADGKVLAAGGAYFLAVGPAGTFEPIELTSAELYDPATGLWSPVADMISPRYAHAATLLIDGRVLVAGGVNFGNQYGLDTAESYDPISDSWTAIRSIMNELRETDDICCHAQIALPAGDVLAIGGFHTDPVPSAELYHASTGTWSAISPMQTARLAGHTATRLNDGTVLVVGGYDDFGPVRSSELYDPATTSWSITAPPETARGFHTATHLTDGRVLVTGGTRVGPDFARLASAELFG
jgi:N-acetylneuraminic acid mutarotase